MLLVLFIFLLSACVILLYQYTTRNHDYWARKNVKHEIPLPFFGNHLQNFLVKRSLPEIGIELYNKYKDEKIVGYYKGTTPELFIRDPEIVRHILTVDFKYFPDRGASHFIKNDPLLRNIVFTTGKEWHSMRQYLIPGFSRSKLRNMFPLLLECVEELNRTVEDIASRRNTVSAYDLMAGYTLQCLGSCGFGLELNTISTEHSNFTNLAKQFFVKSKKQMQMIALVEMIPDIAALLNLKLVNKELESLVVDITRRVREERGSKPSGRNDFIDILIEMEAQQMKENNLNNIQNVNDEDSLKFAAAQLFLLLIGGFETTATAMSTTLHQLAHHPEIQAKVQEDIDQVLSQYDNELTYESLDSLKQLELAILESMRLLAPFGFFRRLCVAKYTVPGTEVTIDPGVRILIPTQALHMDEEYFENPEEFQPERFASEEGKQNPSYRYLAFGEGPRKCIGNKMALMMATAGLAVILRRHTVIPAPESEHRLHVKKTSHLVQIADGGIPVRFTPRQQPIPL